MRGKFAEIALEWVVVAHFALISRLRRQLPPREKPRLSKKVRSPLSPLCEGAPPAGGGGENCTAARNISGYGKVLSLRPFGAPPSQRCVQIHGQPFHENQHRHILLADFSAPIFHFQKNVNLRKIHEVDYAEKDCNNCCSLFAVCQRILPQKPSQPRRLLV